MQGCVYSATSLLIYNFCWRLLSNWTLALAALHLIFPYLSAVSSTAPVCWIITYYSNCNAQWKTPDRWAPRSSHIWLHMWQPGGLDSDLSYVLSFCSVSSKSGWCKQNKQHVTYSLATIVSKHWTCSSPQLRGFLIMLQFVLPRKAAQVISTSSMSSVLLQNMKWNNRLPPWHQVILLAGTGYSFTHSHRSNYCGCTTVCATNNRCQKVQHWWTELRKFRALVLIKDSSPPPIWPCLMHSMFLCITWRVPSFRKDFLKNTWKQSYYCFFPVMVHTAVLHVACCARCPLTLNAKC